ncbi:protein-L-isoaspartate O-methyltransferase [Marinicauda salina]|uniref:Protein-L-isoaspartate O-methyltransferase n=2 Tax=Marinicauda salina TaxID=2135793 RepID=A0A2U2BY82_9PROT|nr:protein-L-isoaspartate O-methyltransferase [Marinicauda salina]
MVTNQLARRGIADRRVLDAMGEVPREAFLPADMAEFAYEDSPLPIASGQTISQPFIVGRMIELAELEPGDRVLEVGAGSGYAAAVMSRIAERVFAIERHGPLAEAAREAIEGLGYDNLEIVHGDGTEGLPDEAPFDAIVVSAGGELPAALKDQLAVGGRLVIPLPKGNVQVLAVVRRLNADRFETVEHDAVRFVPLIASVAGAERAEARPKPERPAEGPSVVIARAAEPFESHDDLARLVARFADKRVVCLGEATHGTSEFYAARAAITERLVRDHGFTVVAVEADWSDAAYYDRAIRSGFGGRAAAEPFMRFPRWMWRNQETWDLLKRLKAINDDRSPERQAGFYGLDVYSLCESIGVVLDFLEEAEPDAAAVARERYACLTPYCGDPAAYGRMRIDDGYRRCEDRVASVLADMLARRLANGEAVFDAEQNARIVAEAERYYRTMYYGGPSSWNLRDQHMFDTLERLLVHRGPDAKAVVWAHNSHVGDARATEMGRVRGEHTIGQLVRQRFGDGAALIGFGTERGEVAAADEWGGRMTVKTVRRAMEGSWERHCGDTGVPRFLLDMTRLGEADREALTAPALERAIGVVYRPETERASHYFEADLPAQFDAWVWFEQTRAVDARPSTPEAGEEETFPFGV